MVLHEGKVAEMATGEGKTLAALLPAYLNALSGRGVHIITVNVYLAARDREWCHPGRGRPPFARSLFPTRWTRGRAINFLVIRGDEQCILGA
jgi:hypothetical protein